MPIDTADGLLDRDQRTLEHTYRTLQEVCREEGNSVWAWYIFNSVSPATLKERKVDRIVTNPPWVRMSNIQVESRKKELQELITEMDLWPGGKYNTGFDIAGMFITRCRELYLSPREVEKNRAAWVLNNAAIKGGNWQKIRSKSKIWNEEFIDFGELKEAPFTGAKSCALIQGKAKTEREPAQTKMVNLDKQKVHRSDNLTTARMKSKIVSKPKEFVSKRSEYFTGEKPEFRNGATLFPHSLVKVAEITTSGNRRISFVTAESRHNPWRAYNGTQGEVPERYIVDAIFSEDLLTFAVRKRTSQVILPLTKDGNLDSERDKEPYWSYAEASYQVNKGKGGNTPETLWARLDFSRALMRQIISYNGRQKVAYNNSGRYLRTSRIASHHIAENSTFHLTAKTPNEAAYLVSLLNADCLQLAYQQSRKSDRHFAQHFWHTVPIPRYDAIDARHRALVDLCEQAEKVAESVRDSLPPDAGQIRVSEAIRRELRGVGVMVSIDDQARKILPEHST